MSVCFCCFYITILASWPRSFSGHFRRVHLFSRQHQASFDENCGSHSNLGIEREYLNILICMFSIFVCHNRCINVTIVFVRRHMQHPATLMKNMDSVEKLELNWGGSQHIWNCTVLVLWFSFHNPCIIASIVFWAPEVRAGAFAAASAPHR